MPPLRPVWTDTATELLDAPRSAVFSRTARVAVVLHQHLWGKDTTTKDDAAAIKRRITAKGPESVRVVLLDRAAPPVWLRKSPSRALNERELDQCADWIVAAVGDLGGTTRRSTDAMVAVHHWTSVGRNSVTRSSDRTARSRTWAASSIGSRPRSRSGSRR